MFIPALKAAKELFQMLLLKATAHKQAFLLGSVSCHQPNSTLMHQLGMQ